jgi:hypothetical protein
MNSENLWLDLSDLKLEDLEVLTQEGARAIPEFAASTQCSCTSNCCSTSWEEPA